MTKLAFSDFTKKYALSKTLRFELKPYLRIPEEEKEKYNNCSTFTEYHLKKVNLEYFNDEKSKNANLEMVNFLRDQEIEDAYQTLKPIFDKIHEEFITQSLENEEVKEIDFSKYLKFKEELL
jgi:CRISPR-associated protein Cpf1